MTWFPGRMRPRVDADLSRDDRKEVGTVTWYAFKLSETTYGISDIVDIIAVK